MKNALLIAGLAAIPLTLLYPDMAHAAVAAAGGSMPWDTPITNIKNDLTGPTAFALSLIGAAVALCLLVFAHTHLTQVAEKIILIVFVLATVTALASGANLFGITGARI